jgi:phage FluMu protein Com
MEAFPKVGRTDSQRGQRLTLRCPSCNRVLRVYYQKKTIISPAKLVVLNGSMHQTGNITRIHIRCKCGDKAIFERQSHVIGRFGWRRIQQPKGKRLNAISEKLNVDVE